jgi:hypothetical protein
MGRPKTARTRRSSSRQRPGAFPPSAVRRVGVQPTLIPKECTKRRGGLSKLVPLRTPWKGPGKTQNVVPFLDKVRDSVTPIERWPQISIGRHLRVRVETRPMDFGSPSACYLRHAVACFRHQPFFHVCGKAKLFGLSDGFESLRSGRQLLCLCQSPRCPGSPIVTIEIVARQFCHVIVLTVTQAGRRAACRQHRTSSGRRPPAPHE